MQDGWLQYTPGTVHEGCKKHDLQPTTDIYIGGLFMSSSSEVLNSVFDELGCSIDEEQGLKHLAVDGFWDMNSL